MGINNRMYLTQLSPTIYFYHYYVKSMTLIVFSLHLKQCVHREGFNHSYAIKWIKMFLMMKKTLFYEKQHLIISHIKARLFFSDACMFHKVSKLCPHFLSTL